MNVFRKKSVEVTDGYAVGDQIVIRLGNMGGFFATVQKVNEDGSTEVAETIYGERHWASG